ncbi:UNVERIFIED_CONTAM: hypothetical protein Sradi_1905900 [Sesamum radiatum]|uniref:Uncharacterized protein n=1 Tax=Sesamum radiatum TaxID=300843 RepID=A0AAW2TXN6_SESRA
MSEISGRVLEGPSLATRGTPSPRPSGFSASRTPPSIDSIAATGGDLSPPPPHPQESYPDPPLAMTRNKIK